MATASSAGNVGLVMGIAVLGTVVNERLPGLARTSRTRSAYTECGAPSILPSRAW